MSLATAGVTTLAGHQVNKQVLARMMKSTDETVST
jgi:hypothetical protein